MLLIVSCAAGRRIQLNQTRVFYRFKLHSLYYEFDLSDETKREFSSS